MSEEARRTGRTTRQADAYIQMLFDDGEIEVKDHADGGKNGICNAALAYIIMSRLQNEHTAVKIKLFTRSISSTNFNYASQQDRKSIHIILDKQKEIVPDELPVDELEIPGLLKMKKTPVDLEGLQQVKPKPFQRWNK